MDGSPTVETDAANGYYGKLGASGQTLTTDAFTVDDDAQVFSLELYWISTTSYAGVRVYLLSGVNYGTQTQLLSKHCYKCGYWETYTFGAGSYAGQSVKLKFEYYLGAVGVDNVHTLTLFPGYTTTGSVTRADESGNSYAVLGGNGVLITPSFTVDAATQYGTVQARKTSSNFYFYVFVLSGVDYATETQIYSGSTSSTSWVEVAYNLTAFAGQSIKLKFRNYGSAAGHLDDLGEQKVEVVDWEGVTGDTHREEESGNHFVSTNGSLSSQPFTLPEEVDHLILRHRGGSAGTTYRVVLYGGTSYTDELLAVQKTAQEGVWQELRVGVAEYAGQTVKLKLEQYWGRLHFDDIGITEKLLPGWRLSGTHPYLTGEDAYGSYAAPEEFAVWLHATTPISTGIVDTSGTNKRFYSVTYSFGNQAGGIFRVNWHDAVSGQTWHVFMDASNVATEPLTRYFYLADFMGEDGYFRVQVGKAGKFYAISDNIARQQLSEPFSEQAGYNIDTSTGSFGYQVRDLATAGVMPLQFVRYYSGHSAHLGTLGYHWTHSYDTRLVVLDNDDAGVILGSGREIFFDWNTSIFNPPDRYIPVDPRVHDTLEKSGDGTYTYTTSANLSYHFDADGVLLTIADLNGNTVTLARDGQGRVTSVTNTAGRTLTLTYDGSGRLTTVTDPVGAVVSYGYDANGDLTTVIDPENEVWSYAYDRHRLVSVTGPDSTVIFENAFDDWHRVTSQTLAGGASIDIAYDTPGQGATSVTDPEGGTAVYYFDRFQRTTDKLDPLGNRITFQYDGDGNRVRIIDPAFNQWEFGYDGDGNLVSFDDPQGNGVTITYNALHLPTTVWDACSNLTTFTYDANGNPATITNALNHTTAYTYDARGNILTETNALNHTWTYAYDASDNLTSMTDPLNHVWNWTYDANGRVLTETDANGKVTSYQYNFRGALTKVTDALGNTKVYNVDFYGYLLWYEDELSNRTNYQYDSRGNVVTKGDPANKLTTYTYDDADRMTGKTDPLSRTTTYAYDDAGRLVAVTDPLNQTTTRTYDAKGQLASMTDPLNRTISFGYDPSGRLVSTTLPNGAISTAVYDDCGNLTSTTDPLNNTTSYTYDGANQRVTMTDPRGKVTTYAYDGAGNLISETDPMSGVTSYSYDAANRLVSVTDPLNRATTYTYDANGNRLTVTNALNETTSFTYDALNRLTTITDALNQTATISYDATGNSTRLTLPSGVYTDYVYDARGLLTSVTDALANTVSFSYDAAGQLTGETDPNNHTTSYGYDAAGRQTTLTDALNGVVTFVYDAGGRLTSLTNPRGKTTSFSYDLAGNLLSQTDPLNRTSSYTYDLVGNLTGSTNGNGVSASYSNDAAGNLTGVSYPGGSIAYGYDDLGRRVSMTDATGTTTYAYDAASQITGVTSPNGAVGYSYDQAGRRSSMSLPGGRTATYAYDAVGQLTSLTDWQSQAIAFGYNADGQRTSVTRPNGVTTSYGYDGAGRLTSVVHGGGGIGSQFSYLYTLDPAGNRTAVAYGGGAESYTLDALNRVTEVTYLNGDAASYSYDANGNRLSETINGATTSYTYDDADQLISDGVNSYTYDQAGNLTAVGADSYSWDWANRLSGATVGGNTVSYTYDGQGLKVSETTGSTTTTYVYDQASGLPLLVDDGNSTYVHAGGLLAEFDAANTGLYALTDGLGSVRGLTDGTGALAGANDYAVFGAPRGQTGTTSRFGFTGEPTDATTGHLDLRARHYDPGTGRFLSADTVQPNAPGTQGFNRYAYVANNPMRYTDPTGRTISDVQERMKTLDMLFDLFLTIGALGLAMLPLMLLGGPISAALGLAFYMLFLIIVLLMLKVIGEILMLLIDEFDHYLDEAPQARPSSNDPDSLPQEPDEECPLGSGNGDSGMTGMNSSDPFNQCFAECECESRLKAILALDAAAVALTLAATLIVVLGCLSGLGAAGIGLMAGCSAGHLAAQPLMWTADALGLVAAGIACLPAGPTDIRLLDPTCASANTYAMAGLAMPIAPGDLIVDLTALLADIKELNKCG